MECYGGLGYIGKTLEVVAGTNNNMRRLFLQCPPTTSAPKINTTTHFEVVQACSSNVLPGLPASFAHEDVLSACSVGFFFLGLFMSYPVARPRIRLAVSGITDFVGGATLLLVVFCSCGHIVIWW